MKNILILILLALVFCNCRNSITRTNQNVAVQIVCDTVFAFSIQKYYDERSKDCNHYYNMFSLKSGVLYYDYVYKGFPDDEEEHDKKQLNDSIIHIIKEKLKELSLYQDYSKKFPLKKSGFITESGYSMTIRNDSAKYALSVSGPGNMEIDDKIYLHLSDFYYYINTIFPQKP